MQFCLKKGIEMQVYQRRGVFTILSSMISLKIDMFFQTHRARRIGMLNALRNLENHLVACAFSPFQHANSLSQNGQNE
jgi:hypothetical protein